MKFLQKFIIAAAPCLLLPIAAAAGTTTVNVTAMDNIDASGLSSAANVDPAGNGGGVLPLQINLTASAYQFQYLSGNITPDVYNPSYVNIDANGLVGSSGTVNSYGGISAFETGQFFALVGVFLGPGGQPVTAPPAIDFTTTTGIGPNFLTLSPQIGQIFLIGDGTTSSDQTRTYYAPTGATELYLGFADASNFNGPCGQFADNSGSVNMNVTTVPEPAPLALLGAGSALLALVRFRNKRLLA